MILSNTTSALFSFIDEESEMIIALTGAAAELEKIAGGKDATISVDGTIMLWGTAYSVSDIMINMTDKINHFEPSEFEELSLGAAFAYNISIRVMVYEKER